MALTKVSTDGVKDDAITKSKIPANQIEASELADNAVDTNAIANNAVTAGKLASGVQTTINNNADNRVITGSGTANTLNGESNLTFDGSNLGINGDLVGSNNTTLYSSNGGSGVRAGIALSGSDQALKFFTVNGGSERMRIDSSGNIGIGNDASFPVYTHVNSRNFILGTGSESTALQIHSGSTNYGGLYFGDVADRTDAGSYIGSIEYKHGDDYMNFRTNGSERMRIDPSGRLLINGTDANTVHTNADDVIIGKTSNSVTGLSIVTSTSGYGTLQFSDGGGNKNQGQVAYNHSNNTMNFTTAESVRMSIDQHIVKVNDGDIVIGTSGHGINFDTAGSGSDQLLDDYEEGTWTPSVHSGGGSLSTYVATYTKIGRLVHIHCYVSYVTANSSSAFKMGGLPFACANNNYEVSVVDFGVGGKKGAYSRTHTSNTFLEFLFSSESNTGNRQPIRGTHIGSGYIILSNTYITS